MKSTTQITILGGGPGGLLLARLLTLAAIPCQILETDATRDSRHQGGVLDIHEETGQVALRQAGLYEAFRAEVLVGADALRILDQDANVRLEEPGNGERPEISRGSLRRILAESLPEGTIRWQTRVKSVRRADAGFVLTLENGEEETAGVVIGADGAWSRVRPLLTDAAPVYAGVRYVELRFPDADHRHPVAARLVGNGSMFALSDNRGFIGHRESEREVTVYAFVRVPEVVSQDEITPEFLLSHFAEWHPDFRALFTENEGFIVRSIYALPVGLRWKRVPGVTLLGDAAHLMSPFAGEGVNQAFADAADLAEQIIRHPDELETAFAAYEERMYNRTVPIATESAQNLDRMISPDSLSVLLDFFNAIQREQP